MGKCLQIFVFHRVLSASSPPLQSYHCLLLHYCVQVNIPAKHTPTSGDRTYTCHTAGIDSVPMHVYAHVQKLLKGNEARERLDINAYFTISGVYFSFPCDIIVICCGVTGKLPRVLLFFFFCQFEEVMVCSRPSCTYSPKCICMYVLNLRYRQIEEERERETLPAGKI